MTRKRETICEIGFIGPARDISAGPCVSRPRNLASEPCKEKLLHLRPTGQLEQ